MLYKVVHTDHEFTVVPSDTHKHLQTFGVAHHNINKVRNLANTLNEIKNNKSQRELLKELDDKVRYAEMLSMRFDGKRTWKDTFEYFGGIAKWEVARIYK